jgi:histidinol phosphatase-like enzyme (inositol monophosphatase family)
MSDDTSAPPVDHRLPDQAVAWTREAGELTLGWFNHPELVVARKHDGSEVTEADRAAERFLREQIAAHHPDDAIHGEEEPDRHGTSGRRWVLDPIDGTKAFSRGVGTYTNLVYLEDEHGPAIGVINVPAMGETVYAGRGLGCFFDGAPCGVSKRMSTDGAYVCVSGFHGWTPTMFERVAGAGINLRTWGDAYGYALVASGRVEAMFDPMMACWDLAALLVVVPEAGGTITSRHGEPAEVAHLDHPEYAYSAIASNGAFHDELLDLLRP